MTTEVVRILRECGNRACRDHLVVAQDEYARVREEPTLFLIRPGHESAETERVISRNLEYSIVQKLPGLPAEIARATDPNGA